jgi:hypothetical protein
MRDGKKGAFEFFRLSLDPWKKGNNDPFLSKENCLHCWLRTSRHVEWIVASLGNKWGDFWGKIPVEGD